MGMQEPDNSLSVDHKSVTGAVWKIRESDEVKIKAICQRFEVPEIISRIISSRKIDLDDVASYIYPSVKDLLPDPGHLLDMEKATNRIVQAIENKEKIAVFGDYDVDGATSSALLKRYFRDLGVDVGIYIPDRAKEGYGPNTEALLNMKKQGVDLCITVDCGAASFEPLSEAKKVGLDVIVMDHHIGAQDLPEAVAVVNPNRLDESSEYKYLAAVGVCFLFVVSISRELRNRSFFAEDKKEPNLLNLLDIVALGTVCDVVPLKGINRAFVKQGLKVLKVRKNVGLKALCDVAGVDSVVDAYHLGFLIGPRINAGGRVGESYLGSELLSTEDADKAYSIAAKLDRYNAERKAIEKNTLESAIEQVEAGGDIQKNSIIFASGQGWHQGVIGIVASRLKDLYHRPVAVIALENGIGKASARSITGVDFGSAIVAANQNGILEAGGGHAMAAGFTVKQDKIDELYSYLSKKFASDVEKHGMKTIYADGYISVAGITIDLIKNISQLGPFGTSNPEPKFILSDVYIIRSDIVGENHVRCIIGDNFAGNTGGSIKAMAFNSMSNDLGPTLLSSKGVNVSLIGKIKVNSWQGVDSPQFIIEDCSV